MSLCRQAVGLKVGRTVAESRESCRAAAAKRARSSDRITARAVTLRGREAIRDHYRGLFARPPPQGVARRITYTDIAVRIVSDDAAVVDAAYEMIGVGPDPSLKVRGLNTVFMIKRDGAWLRAAQRNFVPTTPECVKRCSDLQ